MTDFILPEMGACTANVQHEKWAVEGLGGSMDQGVLNKQRGNNHIIRLQRYGPWQDLW